jgi:hypothetical protein
MFISFKCVPVLSLDRDGIIARVCQLVLADTSRICGRQDWWHPCDAREPSPVVMRHRAHFIRPWSAPVNAVPRTALVASHLRHFTILHHASDVRNGCQVSPHSCYTWGTAALRMLLCYA